MSRRLLACASLLLLAAGCGSGVSAPSGSEGRILAAGRFALPAADAFGAPGFHEVLAAVHRIPPGLGSTAGRKLVVALRDAGRPAIACSSEHPLSGCATVDWSDAESRPKVPPGGVFENSLTVRLATGTRTLFLRRSGALSRASEPFEPG